MVVVLAFNNQNETNLVMYKDPLNPDANIFLEQLGQSGNLFVN